MQKYVIGRLRLRPGTRDEYVRLHRHYLDHARKEEGLVFYEEGLISDDPDGLLLVECWESPEAHAVHLRQPHYKAFAPIFQRYALHAHFNEIDASSVNEVVTDLG